MNYKKNEELSTIKPNYAGNKIVDGRFLNYKKVYAPNLKDILKWRFTNNPTRDKKKANPWHAATHELKNVADKSQNRIVWLGHASFLITLNGKNIITDPIFNNIYLIKRLAGLACTIDNIVNIDYILISHAHFDHLDKKSLVALTNQNPNAIIYCGLNHLELLRKFKIKNQIIEASWYQMFPINTDMLKFYFMPALHWSKRSIFDRNKRLWGSFVIEFNGKKIFFMGDSGYSEHFKEIASFFDKIDYCILGIGAYRPEFIMKSSHIDPTEAIQSFIDLKGNQLIPMHYGTYDLADEPLQEPIEILEQQAAKFDIKNKLLISNIGETIYI